jgi:hypothetical protein
MRCGQSAGLPKIAWLTVCAWRPGRLASGLAVLPRRSRSIRPGYWRWRGNGRLVVAPESADDRRRPHQRYDQMTATPGQRDAVYPEAGERQPGAAQDKHAEDQVGEGGSADPAR